MKNKLWIAVLLAAATLGTSAYARGGDDRGWNDHRDHGRDQWQHQRHDHWRNDRRHDHWRHDHRPPPYAYGYSYGYGYPPPPRHYDAPPAVRLPLPPLPPPPHEVLRDILRGR